MELLYEIDAHDGPLSAVRFAPDGSALLTAGADRLIKIWSLDSWQETGQMAGHQNTVTCLAFSPDGRQLASGSIDTTIKLWDYPSGNLTATMAGHSETVSALAYSPDGSQIASASFDTTIRLWSVEKAAESGVHMKHARNVAAVVFSLDGSVVVTSGLGTRVHLWMMPIGSWLASLEEVHRTAVGTLAVAPSGEFMASGGWDGDVALWSIPGWSNMKKFNATEFGIHSVSIHPTERFVAASSDTEVSVVDIASTEKVGHAGLETKGIHAVQFSPDGNLLAAGCSDNKLRVWDVSGLK